MATRAELQALLEASQRLGEPYSSLLRGLHAKLTKVVSRSFLPGNAKALESSLVASSSGRVIPASGDVAFWARVSRSYGSLKATTEQATKVGTWISSQPWLKDHVYTIDTLVRHWPNYLARALKDHTPEVRNEAWTRPDYDPEDQDK